MQQGQFIAFAKYNGEFNSALFSVLSTIDDSERKRDMRAFFGSIHGTLNHILLADRIWLGRFAKTMPGSRALHQAQLVYEFVSLRQELCSNFDELRSERQATDRVITDWVQELTDEGLARTMHYTNAKGQSRDFPVWLAAAHMFNHQTHHRGQVTTLLTQLGYDPGVTDLIAYVS